MKPGFVEIIKKIFTRCIPFLFLPAWTVIPCFSNAQGLDPSPISVEVHVAPAQATIGDVITYSIRVRHDSSIEPLPPEFTPPVGLESIDQGNRKLPPKKNRMEQEFWFRLRADQVGSFAFPSIAFPFKAKKGGKDGEIIPGQIATPKAELEVQSILHLHGEPTDIRDIKPLEDIGRNWLPWILGTMAFLLALALAIFLYRRRNQLSRAPSPPVPENLSPQEAAIRQLVILKNKEYLKKGMIREYFFELSEIFRRYLGARFHFQALDWTTEEIKDHILKTESFEPRFIERVGVILEQTDLVKFAKATATNGELLMEEIIIFIQATSMPEISSPTSNHSSEKS